TNTLPLKLSQLKNKLAQLSAKVQADSAENLAALTESQIAATQLDRQRAMYDSGLVSLTQLELRKLQFQSAMAKKASAENKLASSRQELLITATEMNFQQQDNQQEMAKAEGEKFQSLTAIASSQADLAKLRNEYSNYQVRNGMYFITAPQSGQIVKAKKAGIGEFVKDGDMIAEIVPQDVQYAVDIYVEPVDLPLLSKGQKMRLVFDGFPAIVFSGWPEASSGTFAGEIAAVETNLSANGKFRLIVKEDPGDRPWPQQLKIGTGATGIGLLADVPLWYELWRNINGFPADFYTPEKLKGKPGQP
ncbi:MAG: HlyD family efflux transporter periplasmic adaptor subunit, partial [Chitinophagaceae bacterium]